MQFSLLLSAVSARKYRACLRSCLNSQKYAIKKMRKKYPSDITKEQFEQLRSILESGRKKTVPRKVDLSEVILRHTISVEKRLPTAYAA